MTHQLLRNQQNEIIRLLSTGSNGSRQQVGHVPIEDPTGFDATIFRGITDGPQWMACRGILDTGCEDN